MDLQSLHGKKGNEIFPAGKNQADMEFSDPKDRVFYEVVMEERKEKDAYLVTGNIKHFPAKPFIVTPRQMLDIILEDQDIIENFQ